MPTTTTDTSWRPGWTPTAIRYLIATTVVCAICAGLLQNAFTYFGSPGPIDFFSLSRWGLSRYLLWQPFTYPLILDTAGQGITFSFMINLAFDMYLLWVMGSIVLEHLGSKPFLRFYFGLAAFSGLCGVFTSILLGTHTFFMGPSAALLGILMLWTMLHPEGLIYLFFIIPVRAKWLMATILGVIVLVCLSQADFSNLVFYLTGAFGGYFYGLLARDLRGPFQQLYPFEDKMTSYALRLQNLFVKKSGAQKTKIYDFQTGEDVSDDDRFVDEMLEKISKHGEKSLTWVERQRMQKISEKKKRDRNG